MLIIIVGRVMKKRSMALGKKSQGRGPPEKPEKSVSPSSWSRSGSANEDSERGEG